MCADDGEARGLGACSGRIYGTAKRRIILLNGWRWNIPVRVIAWHTVTICTLSLNVAACAFMRQPSNSNQDEEECGIL
jgi:hypothetical protein